MKKTLALLLIAIVALSAVFAGGESEAAGPSSEKTVVEIWTEDRHDLEYFNKMIAEFNASHDDIEIKLTTVTDNYTNMLVMSFTSGNAPDLFYSNARSGGFDLKTFVDGKMLLAYPEEVLNDPEFALVTDIRNHVLDGVNAMNGKIYSVFGAQRSSNRMIYNADLFEKAGIKEFPKTLDELIEVADRITKVGKGDFYGIATCASAQFNRWLETVCQKSGIYFYDFVNGEYSFDGYKPILEKAQKLFINESMFPGSNTQGVDAMRAQFANGTFALWGNASQEAGVFTKQFPVEDFEWKVAEVPSLDGTVKGAVEANPQKGLFAFASTENPDAVWEVVKYLNSEKFLKGYLEMGYALPYSAHMREIVDMSKIGRLADFAPIDYENFYPTAPQVTVAGDDMYKTLWNCIVNLTDVDACIADLNRRYNDALAKDIKLGKTRRVIVENYDPLNPSANPITYLDK